MARTCSKCNLEKEITDFPNDQVIKGRKNPKRCFVCKDCKYTKYRETYYKHKRTHRVYFNNLEVERHKRYKDEAIKLLGGCCQDCKQQYPSAVYDFHHVNPDEKESMPSNVFQGSWKRVEDEIIKKCVLLCSNCHRIRHIQERECQLKEVQS